MTGGVVVTGVPRSSSSVSQLHDTTSLMVAAYGQHRPLTAQQLRIHDAQLPAWLHGLLPASHAHCNQDPCARPVTTAMTTACSASDMPDSYGAGLSPSISSVAEPSTGQRSGPSSWHMHKQHDKVEAARDGAQLAQAMADTARMALAQAFARSRDVPVERARFSSTQRVPMIEPLSTGNANVLQKLPDPQLRMAPHLPGGQLQKTNFNMRTLATASSGSSTVVGSVPGIPSTGSSRSIAAPRAPRAAAVALSKHSSHCAKPEHSAEKTASTTSSGMSVIDDSSSLALSSDKPSIALDTLLRDLLQAHRLLAVTFALDVETVGDLLAMFPSTELGMRALCERIVEWELGMTFTRYADAPTTIACRVENRVTALYAALQHLAEHVVTQPKPPAQQLDPTTICEQLAASGKTPYSPSSPHLPRVPHAPSGIATGGCAVPMTGGRTTPTEPSGTSGGPTPHTPSTAAQSAPAAPPSEPFAPALHLKTAMVNAEWLSALDAHDGPDGVYLSIDTSKVDGSMHLPLSDGDIILSIGGSRFYHAFGARNKLNALSRRMSGAARLEVLSAIPKDRDRRILLNGAQPMPATTEPSCAASSGTVLGTPLAGGHDRATAHASPASSCIAPPQPAATEPSDSDGATSDDRAPPTLVTPKSSSSACSSPMLGPPTGPSRWKPAKSYTSPLGYEFILRKSMGGTPISSRSLAAPRRSPTSRDGDADSSDDNGPHTAPHLAAALGEPSGSASSESYDDRHSKCYDAGYGDGAYDAGYDDGYADGYGLHDGYGYASAPDDQDNYVPIFDDDAPDADDQDDYVPIFDDV